MARQTIIPPEVVEVAKAVRDQARTLPEYRRAVAALLLSESKKNNFTAHDIGRILGVSRQTIFEDVAKIRHLAEEIHVRRDLAPEGIPQAMPSSEEIGKFLQPWNKQPTAPKFQHPETPRH
ncbi:MAG: helix-turn-helix domain-containing protein [Deltaproteobacteria bacterium]|nr:helix-turn-helix domain-containing protein [Deltaproteobacteria bacterium]